ncbi:DeoR/GlpR transcriptional regulator [Oceanispirochaeta crateris]|uniref:DeoR/GlpR transcriptional regulator n=1 Tax=Oceanispirochaeta crateris TaxID=2518645 RepID=A0A5C1QM32_9SPIO|nr:DeoR/GlpR family DNA-binding transcription regulator [Oceanispirochaeta crateris]QEN09165.1 DeoR/GlpR transcriptional regulator [Oceanispirochaeta crateris]
MSKIEKRQKKLLDLLQIYKRIDISQVSKWLDISETTARRMCSKLEEDQKVIRVHGGVQLTEQFLNEFSYQSKELKQLHEKVSIGNYSASLITSGDRIYLDSGTTIHQFAMALINRIKKQEFQDLVVITNSLANFDPLAEYCKVILVGGEVRLPRLDVCGSISEEIISKFHITKAFLGVDGVHIQKGFMTTDERTSTLNKLILADVDEAYILCDSTKFGKTSFMAYAQPDEVKNVVTDWNLADKTAEIFTQAGFPLVITDETIV